MRRRLVLSAILLMAWGCSAGTTADGALVADVTAAHSEPAAPKCLTDVGPCEDIRDTPNSPVDPTGKAIEFDCYGACGASCKLQDKQVDQTTRCQEWPGWIMQHRTLTYETITGATHEFCSWHDSCYMQCDIEYGEADSRYGCCTAYCDYGCMNPQGFDESCDAGRYAPKHTNLLGGIAFQRVCGNADDYVAPTCSQGKIPDASSPTWSAKDCLVWATTATGIDPGGLASSTGRMTFTKLVDTGAWASGPCEAGTTALE